MIINVLENRAWNQIDSSMLGHITHGVYIFHFHPIKPICQQMTNIQRIPSRNNVFKFGKFQNNIHNRIHNGASYTRHWRYDNHRERKFLGNQAVESYSFEHSTTRYLIFDASHVTNASDRIINIERDLKVNWPIRKKPFFSRSEYFTFDDNPNPDIFLESSIQSRDGLIEGYINAHQ
jgi:hypothetical protein